MPVDIFRMCRLSVLLMRNNPLKQIMSDIEKLQHLRTVIFSFCQLTMLPTEYGFMYERAWFLLYSDSVLLHFFASRICSTHGYESL